MAQEFLNVHTHNTGFGRFDWDYATDASVDLAAEKLNAVAHDGVSADELLEFIKSATDGGQITDREARQISQALRSHYAQMSPEARAIADKFEAKFQGLVDNLHDASDDRMSGLPHDWLGLVEPRNVPPGVPELDDGVLQGGDMDRFIADLDHTAHPLPQFVQIYHFDPARLGPGIIFVRS
jgi:hypothetical protein